MSCYWAKNNPFPCSVGKDTTILLTSGDSYGFLYWSYICTSGYAGGCDDPITMNYDLKKCTASGWIDVQSGQPTQGSRSGVNCGAIFSGQGGQLLPINFDNLRYGKYLLHFSAVVGSGTIIDQVWYCFNNGVQSSSCDIVCNCPVGQ